MHFFGFLTVICMKMVEVEVKVDIRREGEEDETENVMKM
jgi:hypothetical protein